jgi:acyl-CoA thioester hydrolase
LLWKASICQAKSLHGYKCRIALTWPVAVKGASITLAQEVRRGEHVLVRAQVRVAFISEGRAQPIPKALRTLLKADLI